MTEFAEENQGIKSVDDLNTAEQHVDQSDSEFITYPTEADNERTSRCEGSVSDKVMLKVVFTPTVHNDNSISGNEKSANDDGHTAEEIDSANARNQDSFKTCEMTTTVPVSSDSLPGLKCAMQADPTTRNVPESMVSNIDSTVSNIDHVMSQTILNGDDTKSIVNDTTNDVIAATQEIDGEETNTVENKKTTMNSEMQDDCNVSTTELLSKTCTSGEEESSKEGPKVNVTMPITSKEIPGENQVVEGAEDEKPMCGDKVSDTVKSNNERKRSASSSAGNPQERDESPSNPIPRKRASTISFKVESTTLLREVSLEIEPLEVVVSSCSTSPISELQEDSKDEVIVNPEAEQVSYTLTRKRAKSGLDSVIKKSANSAFKRSVKVNASIAMTDLDDAIGDENLSPVPRVSTLNRYRNTFSWTRGRTLTRQSFAGKSKDNFLSFHNISYTVQQKKFFRALRTKTILKNIRYVIKHYKLLTCMYVCI